MLHIVYFTINMHMLHVYDTGVCYMYMLYVYVTCICYMYMLHVYVTGVHTYVTCIILCYQHWTSCDRATACQDLRCDRARQRYMSVISQVRLHVGIYGTLLPIP